MLRMYVALQHTYIFIFLLSFVFFTASAREGVFFRSPRSQFYLYVFWQIFLRFSTLRLMV